MCAETVPPIWIVASEVKNDGIKKHILLLGEVLLELSLVERDVLAETVAGAKDFPFKYIVVCRPNMQMHFPLYGADILELCEEQYSMYLGKVMTGKDFIWYVGDTELLRFQPGRRRVNVVRAILPPTNEASINVN